MTDFDPAQTNAIYDTFAPAWQANRDFAELHEHVLRNGTYLDRFGAGTPTSEAASQYAWRRVASFAIDYCADLIDLRLGNLFLSPPQRAYDDSPYKQQIEAFLNDVDGAGTGMDAFMLKALRAYYVNGVDIVVDKTAAPDGVQPTTLAQEQALGIKPVAMLRGPLERLDWAADHAGRYLWVRYALGREPRESETAGEGALRYLTLTPSTWTLYRASESDGTSVVSGVITPAELPVVPFYVSESANPDWPKTPLGILTRITPIARAMLNLLSQGQLDIYMAIGIMAATGVDADRLPTEISPMCWVALPEGSTVTQLSPNVAHLAEKREWLALMTQAMLRIGKVSGIVGADKGSVNSGVQAAVERTDLDNEMKATAGQCEQVERDVVRLAVQRALGREVKADELGYSVEYNRKFVLSGITDIIAQASEFLKLGVNEQLPDMTKVFARRILDQLLRPTDPRYDAIVSQIDAASFDTLVQPAANIVTEPQPGMM